MIENFRPLRQALGSDSCVPTCVRAVLLWHHQQVSKEEVSEWCREEVLGCLWSETLAGLSEEGFTVDELRTEDGWGRLIALVSDEDDPHPVIVTLQEPFRDLNGDHAVVVLDVVPSNDPNGGMVLYMDPLSGVLETDSVNHFRLCWNQADRRAFTISP